MQTINKLNASFAQFTYYLNYKDFTIPIVRYQKEMEILDYVTKECKKVFENHGAQFIESSIFQPVTNSFTIFIQKINNNFSGLNQVTHKKDKKKGNFNSQNEFQNNPYIMVDFSKCLRMLTNEDEYSFEKQ